MRGKGTPCHTRLGLQGFPPRSFKGRRSVTKTMLGRIILLIFSVCAIPICGTAQTAQPVTPQPQSSTVAQPKSFTSLLKKTVGFLRVSYLRDGALMETGGTCFFVFYEDKRLGEDRGFFYLVTNRHMANPGIEDGNNFPVQ